MLLLGNYQQQLYLIFKDLNQFNVTRKNMATKMLFVNKLITENQWDFKSKFIKYIAVTTRTLKRPASSVGRALDS